MGIFDAITGAITGVLNYGNQKTAEDVQQGEFNQQLAFQEQQASSGIQEKVADARAAGISPLAALGASSFSPSPISLAGGSPPQLDLKTMGSSLDDVIGKGADVKSKSDALSAQLLQAQIDKTNMETSQIASDIRRTFAAPGAPPTWNGFPPLPQPDPRYTSDIKPATQRFRMPDGSIGFEPSQAFTQSSFAMSPAGVLRAGGIETQDVTAPDVGRMIRNLQLPNLPAPSSENVP